MFLLQKQAAENIYWVEAFSLLSQIFPVWHLSVYRASLVQLALFVCESLNWNLSRFFSELVFVPFINSDLRYAGFSSIELSIIQPFTSNTSLFREAFNSLQHYLLIFTVFLNSIIKTTKANLFVFYCEFICIHIEKSHLKGLYRLRYPTLLVQGSLSRGAKCKTPEAKRLKFFDQAEVVHGSASRANNSSKGQAKERIQKGRAQDHQEHEECLKHWELPANQTFKKMRGSGKGTKRSRGRHSWLADWEQVWLIKQVMAGLKK